MHHLSLSGGWSGAYRYPRDAGPETVFNAQLEEVGGGFTGTLQEPSVERSDLGPLVTAEIEGVRTGFLVSFIKFYDGSGGLAHTVGYEGTADAKLTRIDGVWTIPGVWSGTFFMTRDDNAEAEQASQEAEAEIAGC